VTRTSLPTRSASEAPLPAGRLLLHGVSGEQADPFVGRVGFRRHVRGGAAGPGPAGFPGRLRGFRRIGPGRRGGAGLVRPGGAGRWWGGGAGFGGGGGGGPRGGGGGGRG